MNTRKFFLSAILFAGIMFVILTGQVFADDTAIEDVEEVSQIFFAPGDVNTDNKVDIADAVWLSRYCASPKDYTTRYPGNLDFDGNGHLDMEDARHLLGYTMLPSLYPLSRETRETLRISFIDSDTKKPIPLSEIFAEDAVLGLGTGKSYTLRDIELPVFDYAYPSSTEIVFKNVPPLELNEWGSGSYKVFFDFKEVQYVHPGTWDDPYYIGSYDITKNVYGEYVAQIKLQKYYLKVAGELVTESNAQDVFNNKKVSYDYKTNTLTLNSVTLEPLSQNSNWIFGNIIESNLPVLTVNIPEGITSCLFSERWSVIDSNNIRITGKGTLRICSDVDYYAMRVQDCHIEDTTVIFEGESGGITCSNLVIDQADFRNTGVYGYSDFIRATSMKFTDSTIDLTSIGSNILWTHGNIDIKNSVITLYCVDDNILYSAYSLFAEMGSVNIDKFSTVNLVAPNVEADKDYKLLCATNGIFLENGLVIRSGDGKNCESYQGGDGRNYSVRCTDGTYPTQIFVAPAGTPIPPVKFVTIPDAISIDRAEFVWYVSEWSKEEDFFLFVSFALFDVDNPTVTTSWGASVTPYNDSGKKYWFRIDVLDTWRNSGLTNSGTLGTITITAGNKTKDITVIVNDLYDVSFIY